MIFDHNGNRKYLTMMERKRFIAIAATGSVEEALFCRVLAYTGCRISEALELTMDRLDETQGTITFRSLKKREKIEYRAVPVPRSLLRALMSTKPPSAPDNAKLWAWGRTTAWKVVKRCMAGAAVEGPHASPKGLRHSFGITAIQSGVPMNLIQKWLGHSRLETTAIYLNAIGEEERSIAKKMW